MANFALTLEHGPRWDDAVGIREQVGWGAHAAFMDALVADGFLLLGGPLADGRRTLHVIAAPSAAAVRRRMAEDPWARDDLLRVGSIEPWQLWLDFRAAR